MPNFTVMEAEELGKLVGDSLREQFPDFLAKSLKDDKKEEIIQKLVDGRVRELLRKSATRSAPWAEPLTPTDVFTIEKRLYEPAGKDEDSIKLQELNDDVYLLTKSLNRPVEQLRMFKSFQTRWSELAKALNISTAGQGLEWIPEGFSSAMIEMVELEAVVTKLFYQFTMPTSPYTYPLLLGDGEAYKGGLDVSDDPAMFRASTPTTDDLTFTAVKMIANYPVLDDMEEDSIVPVMPMMKKSIARAMAKAEDNATINGQLSGTIDTGDTIQSYDARMCWDGLRKLCPSDMKQSGSTWDTDAGLGLFRALREDMGIFGLMSKEIKILANVIQINKFKGVAEYKTVDKAGSIATIIDGEMKKFDGVDIIPSGHVFENLNTSGVYDGSDTSDTQFLLVYPAGFWIGNRKNFTMETERVIRKGIIYLVVTQRKIWKPVHDLASNYMIGWLYAIPK